MATTTLTFACIGSAFADSQLPSQNFHGASSYTFPASYNSSRLYFKFEPFPEAYKRRVLQTAYVNAYWIGAAFTSATKLYSWQKACGDFDENTLTYNTSADDGETIGTTEFKTSISNPVNIPVDTDIWGSAPFRAKRLLGKSCMYIKFADHTKAVTFNTQHASNKPTLVATFDDQIVDYRCRGTNKTSGYVDRFVDNIFKWSIVKHVSGDYCVADPVQVSAVFHWRQGSSGSFNEIEISGDTKQVTIPANTFQSGSIQWYVTAKDNYNIDLREDSVYTVSTLVGDLKAEPASPINGAFCDPSGAGIFRWTNANDHNIITQTGADLQYSTDGTNWTDLGTVTGQVQSYVVPAGVFTASTYYWRVRAYNVDGAVGPWSEAAEFSTVDSTMYGAPAHPVSEICDYTAPITFEWTYSSDTGTIPQRTDLQTSVNGVDWTDRAQLGAGDLSYTVAANTFAAGSVYWRVRCYNSNDVAGPWSSAVSFVAYGAPPKPSVSVDAVPFAVIRWQSAGQIAYKLTVDGVEFGPFFGTAKSFTLRDYLPDGAHAASAEIQGAYGLWSPPGEIQFNIENVPGDPVNLSGRFKSDAALTWTAESETADFLIYRDGVQIGHTSGNSFTDRVVLGLHEWRVVNRLPGGYYRESNTLRGTLRVCAPTITPLAGGDPVVLRKSESEYAEIGYSKAQTISMRQFAGQIYPQAEVSPYLSLRASFDAAWTYAERAEAARFEALIGKAVIFKAKDGTAFVGIVSAWNLGAKPFFRSYAGSVTQTHWRDYVDEDA